MINSTRPKESNEFWPVFCPCCQEAMDGDVSGIWYCSYDELEFKIKVRSEDDDDWKEVSK